LGRERRGDEVRRRRKRQEAASEKPAPMAAPETAQPDPVPAPALRVLVVGQAGATREALETAVDSQADMDLVGSFDDMDSGISGIRANTRRSGVVVLVDVATLETTGAMTEIRRLRDRFPFCRFLVYGDAFDEDAANALLFFGADAVVGVDQGPTAVARAIRRDARPGEVKETEAEADGLEALEEDHQTEPEQDPPPQPDPAASLPDQDGAEEPDAPDTPRPSEGPAEEIWPTPPSTEHVETPRRMTPNDIWDHRASEVRLASPSAGDPDPRTP
jgi:DNA-binding NarL/FixJ family response regulator